MKKSILLIAFLVIATMAYPQTRRTRSESSATMEKKVNTPKYSQPSNTSSGNVRTSPQSTERRSSNVSSTPNRAQTPTRSSSSPSVTPSRSSENARTINRTPSQSSTPQRSYSGNTREANNNARINTPSGTSPSQSVTPSGTTSGNQDRTINRSSSNSATRSSSTSGSGVSREQNGTNNVRSNVQSRPVTSPSNVGSRTNSEPVNRSSTRTTANGTNPGSARGTTTVNKTTVHVVHSPIVVRETRVVHHNHYVYRPIEYRRVHYHYRAPLSINIFWTNRIYSDFVVFYPHHRHYINLGYERDRRIHTISAYDAMYHIGEVMKVYGEVSETYYSRADDLFYLYIGGPYPYHDFSIMIEGKDYRRYRFPNLNRLEGAHIWSMGLITEFEGKPEVLIRKPYQLGVY